MAELLLRINTDTKQACLEIYENGQKVDTIDGVKELEFKNYDNQPMMTETDFFIAGTAATSENGETRIRRFINPDSKKYAAVMSRVSQQRHPNDNGNRAFQTVMSENTPKKSGVLEFMQDVFVRQGK